MGSEKSFPVGDGAGRTVSLAVPGGSSGGGSSGSSSLSVASVGDGGSVGVPLRSVDCRPWRIRSRWPLAVAQEC